MVDRTLGAVIHWENVNVVANAGGPPGAALKVFGVRTVDPRFKTTGGIGVGSTYRSVKRSLGKPTDYSGMPGIGGRAGWASGVWVDVDTKGRVVTIGVEKPCH